MITYRVYFHRFQRFIHGEAAVEEVTFASLGLGIVESYNALGWKGPLEVI